MTVGFVAVAAAVIVGLLVGPIDIPITGSLEALLDSLPLVELDHGLTETEQRVLLDIRFPRVALGALVGSVLAMAGAAYQGVFRNPLADPYLLGVAAGGGLGATLAVVTGADRALVVPFALAGAL
ncbi:MAG: iron ABC transporter permease, partial [Actinobacteria bacterium]|nr:iron ABC transporter permease [Actinomycetota bacterium]